MEPALSLQTACAHCGTYFAAFKKTDRFCCSGCEFVFGLIHAEGLDRFYELKDANPPACPVPVQTSTSKFEYMDDASFIDKTSVDGLNIRFYLEGLNCTACLWLLEKLPSFCADAVSARINLSTSTIEIRRSPGGSFAEIARTLNRFGYRPHPLRDSDSALKLQLRERRRDLVRIGIAAAATGNIMILAVSLYGGATGELAAQFRWLSLVLATPVLTYCAWPFYLNTWSSFVSRRLNIDVPIVAAIFAGVIASTWGLATGHDTLYFDSLSMLVFLLLSSRFVLKGIQARQKMATNLEDELLLSQVERINPDGTRERVSSLALIENDHVTIESGVVIPADGTIVSGFGSVNASVLTGESIPVAVQVGSRVEAGCVNVAGEWVLEVEKTVSNSRLASILRETEKSSENKSRIVQVADRVSQYFIYTVFTLAAATLLYFVARGQFQEGLSRALALIIVTCPCVFGVAIPLSMSFAIRGAARRGIVVKDADAIERLWKTGTVFFDKTGTLTTGDMSVVGLQYETRFDLGVAYALEKNQTHPVARALVRHLKNQDLPEIEVTDIELLRQGGLSGRAYGISYELKPLDTVMPGSSNQREIRTAYGLFCEDSLGQAKMILSFELVDQIRPEALELLKWMRNQRFSTKLISGDRRHAVENTARRLGFNDSDVIFEATPESKAETLKEARHSSIMIGDGANDAAALAQAGLGIAVCGSLDTSLRAADIYLSRPLLSSIRDLIQIARAAQQAIHRNLLFSASFNVVSGTLAILGLMSPLWAAVLMPMSSITVLISAVWTSKRDLR